MRISDWSSDVCSSDLARRFVSNVVNMVKEYVGVGGRPIRDLTIWMGVPFSETKRGGYRSDVPEQTARHGARRGVPSGCLRDRMSVVQGKSVSVSVDLGGRRSIKKKTKIIRNYY